MTNAIITAIVEASAKLGLNQKALAQAAQVSEENLSRIKTKGNPTLSVLERLASSAGLRIAVVPANLPAARPTPSRDTRSFREKHKTLVWSNSGAGETLLLQRALLQPRFNVLLDAAVSLGLPRLQAEWGRLLAESSPEVQRAAPVTNRILTNIKHGYEQASA